MKPEGINMYQNYVTNDDRFAVFLAITQNFAIKRALYPGSYIHITPSLVIPEVIYVDTDKKAQRFFSNKAEINQFVETNKIYNEPCTLTFMPADYWKALSIPPNYVDLMISQYAGFVSQACKQYLLKGGLLLANDSHGDATLANEDQDFEFIGVLANLNGNYNIVNDQLDKYFELRSSQSLDLAQVRKTMKGPKYLLSSEYYLFRKLTG